MVGTSVTVQKKTKTVLAQKKSLGGFFHYGFNESKNIPQEITNITGSINSIKHFLRNPIFCNRFLRDGVPSLNQQDGTRLFVALPTFSPVAFVITETSARSLAAASSQDCSACIAATRPQCSPRIGSSESCEFNSCFAVRGRLHGTGGRVLTGCTL